uniref:Uncharacterized protein n=1 Tax=Arundo donax TaxID=35708 RepID=A0A0A9BCK6_ARUDO
MTQGYRGGYGHQVPTKKVEDRVQPRLPRCLVVTD